MKEACGYAEVSRDAYYRYCAQHPEFRDEMHRLRGCLTLTAKTVLMNELNKNKNAIVAMKILELEEKKATRREYSRRWRAEQKERMGVDVKPVMLDVAEVLDGMVPKGGGDG